LRCPRRSGGSTSRSGSASGYAYTLAFGGLLLLGGRLADRRRRTFLVGLAGFASALLENLGEDYRDYAATHQRLVPFIW